MNAASGQVGQRFGIVTREVMAKLVELSPIASRLYLALAMHADADGACFPSRKALAEMAGTNEEVTRKTLRALEGAGILETVPGSGRRSSHYRLPLHPLEGGLNQGGLNRAPSTSTPQRGPERPPRGVRKEGAEGSVRTPVTHQENTPRNTPTNTSDFDAFWAVYPKKVGKEAARREWERTAKRRPLLATLLETLHRARQSPQWLRDEGQFIPNPATWLHQGRWDDEPVTVSSPVAMAAGGIRMRTLEETQARIAAEEAQRAKERAAWEARKAAGA